MKYGYFPGCSLKGTGRAYEESLLPVMRHLGVELSELDDWNCCGATAYMAVDEAKACALAARNLARAEQEGYQQILAPCSACYLVLNKTQHYLAEQPPVKQMVDKALGSVGLKTSGQVPVRHPLDILLNDVGCEAVKQKVTRPLKGLKVAPYYGCQIVRPYSTFDNQHNPTSMDRLLEALGATVVDWPLKTKCCGGSLTGTLPEAGLRLAYVLIKEARVRGADLIATICPLCQFNLDSVQEELGESLPVVYFTQILGLAMGGSPREVGIGKVLTPADAVLQAAKGVR